MDYRLDEPKVSSRIQKKKGPLYLLFLLFTLSFNIQPWLAHADDACPDIVEYGGESLDFWFYDRITGEPYSDGQIEPNWEV